MNEMKSNVNKKKLDTKEFELPETHYIRDIENKVFQGIVVEVLSHIEGIYLLEGGLFDTLLGRDLNESVKGIYAEQKPSSHTINIKVEVNILYGLSIPQKAEEIQSKISEEITKLTGLHVDSVHVVFKNIISPLKQKLNTLTDYAPPKHLRAALTEAEEYSDEF